jgi:hypothetical protein
MLWKLFLYHISYIDRLSLVTIDLEFSSSIFGGGRRCIYQDILNSEREHATVYSQGLGNQNALDIYMDKTSTIKVLYSKSYR